MIEAILAITWVTKPKSKTSRTVLYQLASGASFTFLSFYGRASRPNAAAIAATAPRGRSYAKRGKNPLSNLPNYQIHRQVINPRRDGRQLVRLLMLPWSIIMSHLRLARERDLGEVVSKKPPQLDAEIVLWPKYLSKMQYRKAQIITPCLITQPSYSHKIRPAQNGHFAS